MCKTDTVVLKFYYSPFFKADHDARQLALYNLYKVSSRKSMKTSSYFFDPEYPLKAVVNYASRCKKLIGVLIEVPKGELTESKVK